MKSKLTKFLTLALALLVTVGCQKYFPQPSTPNGGSNGSQTAPSGDLGYISFENGIIVESESEIFTSETKPQSKAAIDTEDVNNYTVVVTNEDTNEEAFKGSYTDICNMEDAPAFAQGSYSVDVYSIADIPLSSTQPHYRGGATGVKVVKNEVTSVESIVCSLASIKTSLAYSDDLPSCFMDEGAEVPFSVTLSLGDEDVDFDRNATSENSVTYFKAIDDENEMTITLNGMFNVAPADQAPSYTTVNWSQKIESVRAGQWRKIFINIEHTNEGTAQLNVSIETWSYDEVLDFDVASFENISFSNENWLDIPENEFNSPEAPVLSLGEDHPTDEVYDVTLSIFDFYAEICTDPIIATLTPKSGNTIDSVAVEISTENSNFNQYLKNLGYAKNRVPLYSVANLDNYFAAEVNSDNSLTLAANYQAMKLLYGFVGVHTIKYIAIDSEGRKSYTSVKVNVDQSGTTTPSYDPPVIAWAGVDGAGEPFDFENRYEISTSTTMPVVINITSEAGISSFLINITGDALTDSDLTSLNLSSKMDLINAEGDMKAGLGALGFPTGDEVKGAKSLSFDITTFMPMLAGLDGADGKSQDFELVVSDLGGETTQTLKVIVNNK